MFRSLLILAVVALLAMAIAPQIIPALTWVLAFLSLLMLGDLTRSEFRKFRGRSSRRRGATDSTPASAAAPRDL